MKNVGMLALLVLGTGCSVGSFNGTVAGFTLKPKDAISAGGSFNKSLDPNMPLPPITMEVVRMSNTANACSDLNSRVIHANEEIAVFVLISIEDTGAYPAKGTYSADPNGFNTAFDNNTGFKGSTAVFETLDANCQLAESSNGTVLGVAASSGTVSLDSADAHGASGSFNLVFGEKDKVTGSFAASDCDQIQAYVNILAEGMGYDIGDASIGDSSNTTDPTCDP